MSEAIRSRRSTIRSILGQDDLPQATDCKLARLVLRGVTSAHALGAATKRTSRYLASVPQVDSCTVAKQHLHSITSSATASSDGGTSRPSAFAVLRLMTSSYLVGACTGRSAGFSPLRMRST